ncbi:MAG: hypothetical protein WHT82_12690, partial [Limisphaera sp.]
WDGPGAFGGASGPVIHNLATGLIEARSDAPLTEWNAFATLNNEGVFRKTSSGDKTMRLNVNNRGRFEALAGSLLIQATRFNNHGEVKLNGGVTLTLAGGGTNSGAFTLQDTARLVFAAGGLHHLRQGATFSGPGMVELGGPSTEARLVVDGEVSMLRLTVALGKLSGAGTLTVTETMHWTGGSVEMLGGTLVIAPGAVLAMDGAGQKTLAGTLQNGGTIIWEGTGAFQGASGPVIHNLATGLIEARSDAPLTQWSGPATLNNEGVFRKVHGLGTKALEAQFVNSGRLELLAGTLQVRGNFTNSTDGTVHFALGGPAGGSDYGVLAVTGRAQLDGAIEVALTNGFRPALSNLFQVITANPRIGTFSTERGLLLGEGLKLTPLYAASSVSLLVTNAPAETPLVLTLERAGEGLRLSWQPALTNVTVLSTEDLAAGTWSEFVRSATNWLLIAPTNELRFFRVRQP